MKNILKNFLLKKIINQNHLEFKNIKNQPEVKKLFDVFQIFRQTSEISYVGGCIEKF